MTRTEGRAPQDLQSYFRDVEFPTDRDHLLQAARMNGAGPDVVEEIRRLPDLRFEGPQGVVRVYEEHRQALHRERSRQPPRQH